jgi:hypothetical protein
MGKFVAMIAQWLRDKGEHPDPADEAALIHLFLQRARSSGFSYELVEVDIDGKHGFEARWTHGGATFVGFKQPPPQATPGQALLAGCAALLENEWCRTRLTESDKRSHG